MVTLWPSSAKCSATVPPTLPAPAMMMFNTISSIPQNNWKNARNSRRAAQKPLYGNLKGLAYSSTAPRAAEETSLA